MWKPIEGLPHNMHGVQAFMEILRKLLNCKFTLMEEWYRIPCLHHITGCGCTITGKLQRKPNSKIFKVNQFIWPWLAHLRLSLALHSPSLFFFNSAVKRNRFWFLHLIHAKKILYYQIGTSIHIHISISLLLYWLWNSIRY